MQSWRSERRFLVPFNMREDSRDLRNAPEDVVLTDGDGARRARSINGVRGDFLKIEGGLPLSSSSW
jgi:hypothetical protein